MLQSSPDCDTVGDVKEVMAQRQPTAQLIFPNRENVTTGQIQNVLQVCNLAVTGLINPWRGFVDSDGSDNPKQSEARIALENTLIKACDRLDKILDDDQRWTIDYQKGLEDEFKKSHAENLKFLEAQRKASEEITTPHFQWRPTIMKSEDGNLFVALLGDPEKPTEGITGIGRTPEEALEEFDKNFRGKQNSPEVLAFLKARSDEQKMYEHQTVDPERNSNAGQSSGEEDPNPENSRNPGPKRGLGEGINTTFGPKNPRFVLGTDDGTLDSGFAGTQRSGREPRTSFVRKVASFLSRFFRLGKSRPRS